MRKRFLRDFIILVFFLVFIIFFTYPLGLSIKTSIPGFKSTDEPLAVINSFWWFKYSFLHNMEWTHNKMLAYPFGIEQYFKSLFPIWMPVSRLVSIITKSEIFTYNIFILTNLLFSLIFMYWLMHYLTKDSYASFFSAVVFSFCPYEFARIWQHFALTFIQWMPLYLFALFRLVDHRNIKDIIFCTLACLLVIFSELHYSFFMFIATVLFLIILFFKSDIKKWEIARSISLIGFIVLLFFIFLVYPPLKEVSLVYKMDIPSGWSFIRPFGDLFEQSARPLSYFLPPTTHPIFGKITDYFVGTSLYGKSYTEHALYLGWIPIILSFIAIKRYARSNKAEKERFFVTFFIFLAILAWLFSQPPWWNIFGFKIYMPSFFIYKILPMFRAYCRFGILLMLAVSILAGFGLKYIISNAKRNNKIIITAIFLSLVVFEFINFPPFKVIELNKVPQVYAWLKKQPEDLVIAEYPLDLNGPDVMYMLYQTKHEKKMINATIPGTYANKVSQKIAKLSEPNTAGILKRMGVRYVLIHKQAYLDTGLIETIRELNKIPQNPYLKFINSAEGIDVYEVSELN